MPLTSLVPYQADSRANRIEKHLVTTPKDDPLNPRRWLYVRGPVEAMKQIDLLAGQRGVQVPVPGPRSVEFNHRRRFQDGLPQDVAGTVDLLENVLTMRSREHLDFAVALDWYKVPDPAVEPSEWSNTEVGELVNRSKYRKQRPAIRELLGKMLEVIELHPLLNRTEYVATVPGHNADGNSFGEALAQVIAGRTGKTVMQTTCPSGPRAQQKEGLAPSPDGLFEMPQTLWGEVLIIDDVYKSGATMNAVALAAREAGADNVYGLAAVRTMRK